MNSRPISDFGGGRTFVIFGWIALVMGLIPISMSFAASSAKNETTSYVIEDGESHPAETWYDEKPALLENTQDRASHGSQSLHFKTADGVDGHSLITKYQWPELQDFSVYAKSGAVSFDIWVRNPRDMRSANMGALIEFTLMSRGSDGDKATTWYIGSSLFKAEAWNHVELALRDGAATLAGSVVNGVLLNTDPGSAVESHNTDWLRVNYHRWAIPHHGVAVDGYLDNLVISARDVKSAAVINLQLADPTPHLGQVEKNKLKPTYDLIPPDVRKDAFFADALVNFDTIRDWKAELYDCEGVFCLSQDQALRGVPNAKIEIKQTGPQPRVVLKPPAPIPIKSAFDTIECWIYTYTHGGTLGLTFQQKDGTSFRWSGGGSTYDAPGLLMCWTIARKVLPRALDAGAELIAIDLTPPSAKVGATFLFHLDQLRLSLFRDEIRKPAPKFNPGNLIRIPTNENGVRPTMVEKVETVLRKEDGRYAFIYRGGTEGEVRFVYAPKTGTLSDLRVERPGKSSFRPAVDSGPMFDFGDETLDVTTDPHSVAQLTEEKVQGDTLRVTWRYGVAPHFQTIRYHFSLKGKTLQIEAESDETTLSNWKFGHAECAAPPKVIELPFMLYSPNVLCSDGLFVTYYFDWYRSNTGFLPYLSEARVKGNTAYYHFIENGLGYGKRTDGKRHPFRECFYITASANVEEVLLNIANPPSPFRDVLKERLFKMVGGPGPGFMKLTRDTIDFYDHYGMNKLYYMFHAGLWSNRGGHGNEPWTGRNTLSISHEAEGGDKSCIELFEWMKNKGIYPGYYDGFTSAEPITDYWHYDWQAFLPDGNWLPSWVQSFHMKPWAFPHLARTVYKERAQKFGARASYQDGWTANAVFTLVDWDHRSRDSGKMIDAIHAVGAGFQRCRENVNGPVFSEGCGRDYYVAGLDDGDYGKLKDFANGKSAEQNRIELLVDFKLRKQNPLHPSVSLNIGYYGFAATDLYGGGYKLFHEFLATQIAFGTIGMLEPYSVVYPDPRTQFPVTLASYYLMQQLQKRYIMEDVDDIRYFDGANLLSSSDALRNDAYKKNMLRIRYKNGLVIHVNCNWDNAHWLVRDGDKQYDLPRGGWFAKQGADFVEYSAIVDGRRVDFVDSPEFTYINPGEKRFERDGLSVEANKIWIKFKTGTRSGETITYPER